MMNRAVNPAMLELARESRGVSQKELAEAIGVTQGKVSKYENGMLLVSGEDLGRIAEALEYGEEFFYQTDAKYGLGSTFLFHRQRKAAPMLLQRQIQALINVLLMRVSRLLRIGVIESEYEFPSYDLDELGETPEQVAQRVRDGWRLPLGPVANVTAMIESAGGIVLKCAFGTRHIDAAHFWLPGLPPLFFVNDDLPGDRLRWTLAHEVGHAVMHRDPTGDVEEQANRFASAFLMPEKEARPELAGLTIERAAALKMRWKVSMQAVIRRAYDLGVITERKYRTFLTAMSARGHRTNEPYPVPVEEPRVIYQLIDLHRAELGYDETDFAKALFVRDPRSLAPVLRPTLLEHGETFFTFLPKSTLRIRLG